MKNLTKVRVGLVATSLLAIGAAGIAPSFADYSPSSTDVVGVGGDTPQYDVNFLADGDGPAGALGYNSTGNYNKLIAFSATADGNGRTAYDNTGALLNPTVVYRAGQSPIQRVSSSGNALSALMNDTAAVPTVNFIFSSTLPSSAQQNTAQSQLSGGTGTPWGGLHVVELGTDQVQIAAASTTNAVPLSANDLFHIYKGDITTWNQVPGNSGGSTATIVPLLPPTTSAIYKQFIADVATAGGTTGASWIANPNVKTVQQNDPTAITSLATSANAIVPFSAARLALFNSGYFLNPSATIGATSGQTITAGVKLLTGTADPGSTTPAPGPAYSGTIKHYVIFRNSALADTNPFQPGGTLNWAETLFSGANPYVASTAGQALLAAAGITPNYQDLGLAHS